MKDNKELLNTLEEIQRALVVATVIADPSMSKEVREELLVKIINPARHFVQDLIDSIEKDV